MDELISKDKLRQEALKIGGHLYSDWDTGGVLALIARQPKVEAKAIEYAHKYCGAAADEEYGLKFNPKYKDFNGDGGDCATFKRT